MTGPTIAQLRNLTDRAGAGLTADEQQRLRDGIDQLASATDGELRRQLADTIRALGKAETELAQLRAARDRIARASNVDAIWCLDQLDAALAEQPAAHNDGPTVREAAADDRRWPLQKTGE